MNEEEDDKHDSMHVNCRRLPWQSQSRIGIQSKEEINQSNEFKKSEFMICCVQRVLFQTNTNVLKNYQNSLPCLGQVEIHVIKTVTKAL